MYDKRDDKKEAVQAWQRVADTINSLRRMQSGIVWNIQNSHFRRQLRIWESVIPLSRRGSERPERTKGAYQRGSGNYSSDEAKEIARLQRELRDTKDALEILKKAISILGK